MQFTQAERDSTDFTEHAAAIFEGGQILQTKINNETSFIGLADYQLRQKYKWSLLNVLRRGHVYQELFWRAVTE